MKTILRLKIALLAYMFCPVMGYPQPSRTIKGVVCSAIDKEPLFGVSIMNNTTGKIVISDRDGLFSLPGLSTSDTLSFTYVGYAMKRIPVAEINVETMTVLLEESLRKLDEVVVNTGYQLLPKERSTGSFTHVDGQVLGRMVSADIIDRLEGVTNGLSFQLPATRGAPSSTPELRIRGLSTINGETSPLIVVDNFPYEGEIANINPNDVESVTVLKDAAASSIWGARAGNGVIVITTKGGKTGLKPVINFNSNISISQKPDLYYNQAFLPPTEAVELERNLFERGLYVKNDWTTATPAIEILFALEDGLLSRENAESMLDALKQSDVRNEAGNYLYRKGIHQQYALNVSGGSEWHQYYVSAGFDKNANNLKGNGYHRITLNAKNDFRPFRKLHIGTSINYTQRHLQNNGIDFVDLAPSGMNDIYVYARLADEDGNPLPIVRNNRFAYTDSAAASGLLDWHYRPLDELAVNDNARHAQEVRLNTAVRYDIIDGMHVEGRYQYQSVNNATTNHYSPESYFARNLINTYTQQDGTRPIPLGGILDRSGSTLSSHYGRLQLAYNNNWKRHEISSLIGFEIRQERNDGNGSLRLYGYDNNVLTYATNINYESSFPLRPLSSGRIQNGTSPGNKLVDRFVSYYGNLAYTFEQRYTVSASARWDASNIFGVDFNQKGVPLWSIGAAWNVTNERVVDVDWINLAKLRITYGSNGNVVRTISALPRISYGSTNPVTRLPMGTLKSVGNPDLSWEKVNTVNIGADFELFNSRISGSAEWYDKSSSNLIGEDFIDPTTGIIWSGFFYNLDNRRNYADMKTRGIDIELNTVNLNKGIRWETGFLFNNVSNKVTNYQEQKNPVIINFFTNVPVVEGTSRDQLYALPWHGLDGTGAPSVMVDGQLGTDYNSYFNSLTYEDLLKTGVATPTFFGAFRNTFTWRSFSTSINILWKAGHKFRRPTIAYSSLFSTGRQTHQDYLKRWQNPGDERTTNIPSMPENANVARDYAYIFSEALIEKGDNIRLHDVNVSYQLPNRYVRKTGLSQIRFYAYAKNLGIIWKRTDYDIDPDVQAYYPQPLEFAFGLQIQL